MTTRHWKTQVHDEVEPLMEVSDERRESFWQGGEVFGGAEEESLEEFVATSIRGKECGRIVPAQDTVQTKGRCWCGQLITDHRDNVRKVYEACVVRQQSDDDGLCRWDCCDFNSNSSRDLKAHVLSHLPAEQCGWGTCRQAATPAHMLRHAVHAALRGQGRAGRGECWLAPRPLPPDTHWPTKCCWRDCQAEYEDPDELYAHTHEHTHNWTCTWNDCAHSVPGGDNQAVQSDRHLASHVAPLQAEADTVAPHSESNAMQGAAGLSCGWAGCGWNAPTSDVTASGAGEGLFQHVVRHVQDPQPVDLDGVRRRRATAPTQIQECIPDLGALFQETEEPTTASDAATKKLWMCEWRSCDVTMDDVGDLRAHVTKHVQDVTSSWRPPPATTTSSLIIQCRWRGCQYRTWAGADLVRHVTKHVRHLVCCWEDCDAVFEAPSDEFKAHMDGHTSRWRMACPVCGELALTDLMAHTRRTHPPQRWDFETDTIKEPVSAFGDVEFAYDDTWGRTQYSTAKYVRLHEQTSRDDLRTLLDQHWGLRHVAAPKLVLLFAGDGTPSAQQQHFYTLLTQMAQATDAWLLTSGLNSGTAKSVGEAVARGQSYNWSTNQVATSIQCVGVAPWGLVRDRQRLQEKEGRVARYQVVGGSGSDPEKEGVSLSPHHTHLLLVDNGTRGSTRGNAAAWFRDNTLRSYFRRTAPPVMVLLGGDHSAAAEVLTTVRRRVPVLVCRGTGRMADIFADVYDHVTAGHTGWEAAVVERVVAEFEAEWYPEADCTGRGKRVVRDITRCCTRSKDCVFIVDTAAMQTVQQLSDVTLHALHSTQTALTGGEQHVLLELAMALDRKDFAQRHLLGATCTEDALHAALQAALVENRAGFAALLVAAGVKMEKFVTESRLKTLYDDPRGMFACAGASASEVQDQLCQWLSGTGAVVYGSRPVDRPLRRLLYWALLSKHRPDVALLLWEHAGDNLHTALAATRIFTELKASRPFQRALLDKRKTQFEELVAGELAACHAACRSRAAYLLQRPSVCWGGASALLMAAMAGDKVVLSTRCCQATLQNMWTHGSSNPYLQPLFTEHIQRLCDWPRVNFLSPKSKFTLNLVSYLVFLLLYAAMLVGVDGSSYHSLEGVLGVWVISFFVQELSEMLFDFRHARSMRARCRQWGRFTALNVADLLTPLGYLSALATRGSPALWPLTRLLYTATGALYMTLVLRYYYVFRKLGPMLEMIKNMVYELAVFMAILLVFLLTYGVAVQALIAPLGDFSLRTIVDIIHDPYWMLYGELNLESLTVKTTTAAPPGDVSVTPLETNMTSAAVTEEVMSSTWAAAMATGLVILTALYLLMGHLLLMNLLIAIFNQVYSSIQDEAMSVWQYDRFYLVSEYLTKPLLPPPLLLLEHVISAGLALVRHIRGVTWRAEMKQAPPHSDTDLHMFVENCHQVAWRQRLAEADSPEGAADVTAPTVDIQVTSKPEPPEADNNPPTDPSAPPSEKGTQQGLRELLTEINDALQRQHSELRALTALSLPRQGALDVGT